MTGRSVAASAPALGAGDRQFDSARPDYGVRVGGRLGRVQSC